MNLDQITKLAAYQAGAIKQAGTLDPGVTQNELNSWANTGNEILEKTLRTMREDYFVRILNSSTNTTAQKIMGIDYTPSTSLALAASTVRYTLPPDFLSLKSLRCVTANYENTKFEHKDVSSGLFQSLLHTTVSDTFGRGTDLFYDITGERTLWLVPQIDAALDIELVYVARTKKLVRYSTGTVAVTDATTAVTGSTTVWSSGTPFDSAYLDMHFGTSASATVPTVQPDTEYDGATLSRVASITTDTALVLASNKIGTLASGTGYILSSVPVIPPDLHYAISDYVTYRILLKVGSQRAGGFAADFANVLAGIKSSASRRQEMDIETVEDWSPEDIYVWRTL